MYKFIDFETFAANALLESYRHNMRRDLPFSTIVRYAQAVVKVMEKDPDCKDDVISTQLDRRYQISFVEEHSNLFSANFSNCETVFHLNDVNNLDEIENKWRWSASVPLVKALTSPEALESLDIFVKKGPELAVVRCINIFDSELVKKYPEFDREKLHNHLKQMVDENGEAPYIVGDLSCLINTGYFTGNNEGVAFEFSPKSRDGVLSINRCYCMYPFKSSPNPERTVDWLDSMLLSTPGGNHMIDVDLHDVLLALFDEAFSEHEDPTGKEDIQPERLYTEKEIIEAIERAFVTPYRNGIVNDLLDQLKIHPEDEI